MNLHWRLATGRNSSSAPAAASIFDLVSSDLNNLFGFAVPRSARGLFSMARLGVLLWLPRAAWRCWLGHRCGAPTPFAVGLAWSRSPRAGIQYRVPRRRAAPRPRGAGSKLLQLPCVVADSAEVLRPFQLSFIAHALPDYLHCIQVCNHWYRRFWHGGMDLYFCREQCQARRVHSINKVGHTTITR